MITRIRIASACALVLVLLSACASMQKKDPLRVDLAGVEPLKGQGMEMRMTVKLRVQNPNDTPVDYKGVALQMEVAGKTFATGVADSNGSVPGFGESVIEVPVTISALNAVKQALGLMSAGGMDKLKYELKGKLGSGSNATRFSTTGEFAMPTATPASSE